MLNNTSFGAYLYSVGSQRGNLHQSSVISSRVTYFILPADTGTSGSHSSPHLTSPLIARVAGPPQMISQPASSIFLCPSLPFRTRRTPGLFIARCSLHTSSSVCLVFFPLSLCLKRWFWTDLMNGRHVHTNTVCVSLRWSGGLRVVRLPAGSWHGHPR